MLTVMHLALLLLEDGDALPVHLDHDFAHIGHSGVATVLVLGLHIEVGQGGGVGAHFGQRVGAVAHEVVCHLVKGFVVGVPVDVADAIGVFQAHRFPVLHPAVLARRAGGIEALQFVSPCRTPALGGAAAGVGRGPAEQLWKDRQKIPWVICGLLLLPPPPSLAQGVPRAAGDHPHLLLLDTSQLLPRLVESGSISPSGLRKSSAAIPL
uniref:Secreted protein n=1 Tax=Malurus cyaneus samueli TaxID=2593467 RepID=A0A8C5X6L6_9PASS